MTLVGHEEARRTWRAALASGRTHHAWLLAGNAGMGKMGFALAAAQSLVGAGPAAEQHPDILVLTRGPKDDKEDKRRAEGKPFERARSIRVDQVRAMQRRLTTRPTIGERRAVIVDAADDLERSASNALLKSLEEPPVGTFFLLVSHRPARLLPTIRSRCRTLRFAALDEDTLARWLADRVPDCGPDERRAAVRAAGGSPGAALAYLDDRLGDLALLMEQIVAEGDPAFVLRGRLAAAIGTRPDRARQKAMLDLARASLVHGIAGCTRAEAASRIAAHEELVRLSGEMATFNYDPGLLAMEIGTLLARARPASEPANA